MSGVHNYEPMKPDFMGKNGFVWWQGVVEDIYDPLRLGRVRVRVLGWHTDDKTQIPTANLPWAAVLMPANNPFVSGKGWSPNGLLQGSWVIGFYRDGLNAQEPVVMGTIGGINTVNIPIPTPDEFGLVMDDQKYRDLVISYMKEKEKSIETALDRTKNDVGLKPDQLPINPAINTDRGFSDPEGVYPMVSRLGEADTNRLARGENIEFTIVDKKNKSLVSSDTAIAGNWSEPVSPYRARYPFNHVYESTAGHVIEYDDTPGGERLHWYHCSGTFQEIHPKGSMVQKVVSNAWDITMNDKMIYVKGNASFNAGKTLKIMMGRDLDIEVGGDAKLYIKGDMSVDVGGNYLQKVKGTCTLASEGPMALISSRIDLNPGVDPAGINTKLSEARSYVGGLIESVSSPDTTVISKSPVLPVQPSMGDFKTIEEAKMGAVDEQKTEDVASIMRTFGVSEETAKVLVEEVGDEKEIESILLEKRKRESGFPELSTSTLVVPGGAISGYSKFLDEKDRATEELLRKLDDANS